MSDLTKRLDKLLDIKQVSELLSVKVSTIYGWIHEGYIPHLKIGKLVRFREEEIKNWLDKMEHCEGRINRNLEIDLPLSGIRMLRKK